MRRGELTAVKAMLNKNEGLRSRAVSAAIRGRKRKLAEQLITESEDISIRDFYEAINAGWLEIVKLFVQKGADVSGRNWCPDGFREWYEYSHRYSPAEVAAMTGHAEILEYLLGLVPETEPCQIEWHRLLNQMLSGPEVFHWNDDVISLLIKRELVDVQLTDEQGLTLLHVAIKHRRQAQAEYLISRDASPVARDRNGKTPLDLWQSLEWDKDILLPLLNKQIFYDSSHNVLYLGPGPIRHSLFPFFPTPDSIAKFQHSELVQFLPNRPGLGSFWVTMPVNNVRWLPQALIPLLTSLGCVLHCKVRPRCNGPTLTWNRDSSAWRAMRKAMMRM